MSRNGSNAVASRFVVGIDLGTTNSALAYVDTSATGKDNGRPVLLPIPQVVAPNQVEDRSLLPSFLYLPRPGEVPPGSLKLPWDAARDFAVGEYARKQGSLVETRLVSSAKSWLHHSGVDRKAPILPWKAGEGDRRISPLEATTLCLRHLAEAWNTRMAGDKPEWRLEKQDIVLTVPASFDPAARELTVEAAKAAGLDNIILLEEPQAAFYAWIEQSGDSWREQVKVGDVALICDVGGGTTDLSLIAVGEDAGKLVLARVAVGDHILLGGDNMDLKLAYVIAGQFAARAIKLDAGQMLMLRHSARDAKEKLFADPSLTSAPVTVIGRGSKVIAGTIKEELTRDVLVKELIDGFFPPVEADAVPRAQRAVGFQEIGLPYASDPAITSHLAHFLSRHGGDLAKHRGGPPRPTAVLFNGGVFKAPAFRDRVVASLNRWGQGADEPVKVLPSADLDLAVARGAAYYGMVRRGKGIRIRGGTARTYYVGVETALPAVPGAPPPLKALCVAPFGMEEGTAADVPGQEFFLVVGAPAEFRFLGSTTRSEDAVGTIIEEWESDIEEMSPVAATLESGGQAQYVPVHLHSKVTEIGTLELWCISRDGKQRWKLEYNVREKRG
ncbi:MAG: Hsp70 family protein [Gemmataceae bacterium]|nr:Hsp70 family protein [Gemmataceae bacterium]